MSRSSERDREGRLETFERYGAKRVERIPAEGTDRQGVIVFVYSA